MGIVVVGVLVLVFVVGLVTLGVAVVGLRICGGILIVLHSMGSQKGLRKGSQASAAVQDTKGHVVSVVCEV
jgi:hypothetical protein